MGTGADSESEPAGSGSGSSCGCGCAAAPLRANFSLIAAFRAACAAIAIALASPCRLPDCPAALLVECSARWVGDCTACPLTERCACVVLTDCTTAAAAGGAGALACWVGTRWSWAVRSLASRSSTLNPAVPCPDSDLVWEGGSAVYGRVQADNYYGKVAVQCCV